MEAYSNCRQFNCVTPIVEQSEYHMFCRDKAELYLPELYNKIGVGFMAWSPVSMSLSENNERLMFSTKGSLKNKSQSYSWTEDELNKEVCCDDDDEIFLITSSCQFTGSLGGIKKALRENQRTRSIGR